MEEDPFAMMASESPDALVLMTTQGRVLHWSKGAAEELLTINETLEQRISQRTAELHEIIEGLESFNRSVSHDLRGPLGGTAGVARLARDCVAENKNDKADRFLQMIVTQADITARMVDALLVLPRTSDVSLQRQRVDVDALVREVIESMQCRGGCDRTARSSVVLRARQRRGPRRRQSASLVQAVQSTARLTLRGFRRRSVHCQAHHRPTRGEDLGRERPEHGATFLFDFGGISQPRAPG
jgi:signal transduction histidine kinase